jgi:hypothetical protein
VAGGSFVTLNPFAYGRRLTGETRGCKKSPSISSQMGGGCGNCCCLWGSQETQIHHICLFSTTHYRLLRLIVPSGLDVSTFATRRLHACHHARAPSGGRWNCGREMSLEFCLNAEFHVTFRDLLHAVKLRHETDSFTSPPKESEDFFALKIRRLRPGANPQTWVPKASMLPLDHRSRLTL